jgi:hypothetical protein
MAAGASPPGVTVIIVSPDLLISTRILDAAARAGRDAVRVDTPAQLPPTPAVDVAFIDWAARDASWADALSEWCSRATESGRPRLVLFGSHTDLAAHAAAHAAGLGPMKARSALLADLPSLLGRSV